MSDVWWWIVLAPALVAEVLLLRRVLLAVGPYLERWFVEAAKERALDAAYRRAIRQSSTYAELDTALRELKGDDGRR